MTGRVAHDRRAAVVASVRALLLARTTLVWFGVPAVVLAVGLLYAHTYDKHIDLDVYRAGVTAWWQGGDPYGPLPVPLPFIYPPFAALVLAPFVVLPWSVAVGALVGTSVLALGATLYVTARRLWPAGGTRAALTVVSLTLPPALLLEPVLGTFRFGQVNLVLMALVAVDCLSPRSRWPRGLLVGVAAAIKLTPAAFLLFFIVRGDYRAAITAVVSGVGATLLGFLVAPAASARFWFGGLPTSGISGSPFHTNQSIQGMLARFDLPVSASKALWAVATVLLILLAVPLIRRAEASLALVVTALVAVLISPTSWSHHWVWVAPAMLVMETYALHLRSARWAVVTAASAVGLLIAPHSLLPGGDRRELSWTAAQHLLGNSYVLAAVGGLLLLFVVSRPGSRWLLPPGRPPRSPEQRLAEVS
ncbi:glycosyltransferase 87 family protein [Lentzea sp. NPDC051208]|uniref:glycosyltransferase 87 family protein n=1 Tax=Lentzea sp. NPDC051208 TaxID=3154642 RepID=UPI0034295F0C